MCTTVHVLAVGSSPKPATWIRTHTITGVRRSVGKRSKRMALETGACIGCFSAHNKAPLGSGSGMVQQEAAVGPGYPKSQAPTGA